MIFLINSLHLTPIDADRKGFSRRVPCHFPQIRTTALILRSPLTDQLGDVS